MLQHELLGLDRRLPAASFQAPSCKVCLVILFLLLFALLLIMSLMLSVTNISNSISITIYCDYDYDDYYYYRTYTQAFTCLAEPAVLAEHRLQHGEDLLKRKGILLGLL